MDKLEIPMQETHKGESPAAATASTLQDYKINFCYSLPLHIYNEVDSNDKLSLEGDIYDAADTSIANNRAAEDRNELLACRIRTAFKNPTSNLRCNNRLLINEFLAPIAKNVEALNLDDCVDLFIISR